MILLALAWSVMTPNGWMPAAEAQQARVLRSPVAWVAIAEVKPTERITACPQELPRGAQTGCTVNAPERSDRFWLKSEVFATTQEPPPPPVDDGKGYVRVTINAGPRPTQWRSGVPIQEDAAVWLRLFEDDVLIESVPWSARLSVVRVHPDRESSHCYRSGILIDVNGNGTAEEVQIGDERFLEAGQGRPHCTVGTGIHRITLHATPEIAEPEFERVREDEVPQQ